jgi:hypothetical protein
VSRAWRSRSSRKSTMTAAIQLASAT